MIVDTFIRRPILASVCSLVIILAGAIAIPTLPIAQFPELAPPQVTVSAFYNGADAQTVETAVTTPLEQAINGVEGMQYITSTSGNDGSSAVTVTFDVSRNLDVAAVDVQNRISQAEGRLPNEVKQVGISVQKVSQNWVLGAGVYSEDNRYDALVSYVDGPIRVGEPPGWNVLESPPPRTKVGEDGRLRWQQTLTLAPIAPAATCTFCSRSAWRTSSAVRLRPASLSGSSQSRIA